MAMNDKTDLWRDGCTAGGERGGGALRENRDFFSFYSLKREGGKKTVTTYKSSVVYSKKVLEVQYCALFLAMSLQHDITQK